MKIRSLILFLLLNFLALYIGSKLSGDGPTSNWYNQLNKAPWTPPGWVFGVAWTTIMICFAIYMSYLWNSVLIRTSILTMFIIQWILNVSWSPIFFEYKQAMIGLMIISVLNAIIAYFWEVLGDMTRQERRKFIQFVWARTRLPTKESDFESPFKIQRDTKCSDEGDGDDALPTASTCFFSLSLPQYKNKDVLEKKLRFAIENVTTMESDYVTNDAEIEEGWRGL